MEHEQSNLSPWIEFIAFSSHFKKAYKPSVLILYVNMYMQW